MTNDLPSVGTEDAQEIAHGLGRIYQDTAADMLRSLAAERDELASRVRELEAEVLDQCRLNGMGAERESALIGRVRDLERNSATIAGLECAVGHLSAMVEKQLRLLLEVEQVCGRDAYGMEFEDGDSELIDKVRAHLDATTDPDADSSTPAPEKVPPVPTWCEECLSYCCTGCATKENQ
ncbi:MAG: hypothetical protein ACRC7C_19865 [Beijerinckiaceae bacterium]